MNFIKKIFTFQSFMIVTIGILFTLVFILEDNKLTTYYGLKKERADEDVNFIIAYHNYDNKTCINRSYKVYTSYFDELIYEIKKDPSILFHEKLILGDLNYINDMDILPFMKLISSSRCIKNLDLNFSYLTIDGVERVCEFKAPNITSITIKNSFSATELLSINNFKCLYKMQRSTDSKGNEIILLLK